MGAKLPILRPPLARPVASSEIYQFGYSGGIFALPGHGVVDTL